MTIDRPMYDISIYDIDNNEIVNYHTEWIILQELVDYCEKYNTDRVRYSRLRENSNLKLNELSKRDWTFGGSFDKHITNFDEQGLLKRYKAGRRRLTYIIPDIPKIKSFVENEVWAKSIQNLSPHDKEITENARIVEMSIIILKLLSKNITTLDEIIDKSRPDKTVKASKDHQIFVKKTIHLFIINHFIRPTNSDGKSNETFELDKAGKELVDLLKSIEQYSMSYSSLIKAIKEKFDIPYPRIPIKELNGRWFRMVDYNTLKRMMNARSNEDRGGLTKEEFYQILDKYFYDEVSKKRWAAKDVDEYIKYKWQADELKIEYGRLFFTVLYNKYVMLLSDFDKNDFATNILSEIVMREIKQHALDVRKYFQSANLVNVWMSFDEGLMNNLIFSPPRTNKFISKEANDAKNSLTNLWQSLTGKKKQYEEEEEDIEDIDNYHDDDVMLEDDDVDQDDSIQ
jgi:hypothetical protein